MEAEGSLALAGATWGKLGDVLSGIEAGKSFRCEERPPEEGEVGIVKVSAVTWGVYDENESKTCFDNEVLREHLVVRPNDFLFSRANTIELVGACVLVRQVTKRLMLSDKILRLRFEGALPEFVLWYLRSPFGRQEIERLATGNQQSMRNIGQDRIRQIRFPLADLDSQRQVVEQLDARLSRLDKAVADLHAAERKLTRHRAATLAAATSGTLVPTEAELAQRDGRDFESGEQLLQRILTERRARWEADQLAAFKVKGKTPANDTWKAKCKEPVAPDVSGLPDLPEGWNWTNLDHLLARIEAGKSFRCEERVPVDEEIGVLKVSAVSWGEYDEAEMKTCLDPNKVNTALFVNHGDFIFSRANTIDLVGACVIAKSVSRPAMLSDKTLRFVFADKHLSDWVLYCLRSPHGRREIERLATGNQESMRNIGQGRIRAIRIPLPPAQELHRVVDAIEGSVSATDNLANARDRALMRSTALRSTILQAAFTPDLAAKPA